MKTKKCQCDLCQKWFPLIRRVRRKLRGKDLLLFDEYVEIAMQHAEDADAAEAKLAGKWPGWGWMVKAVKAHRKD
jgi:hypothetical protein